MPPKPLKITHITRSIDPTGGCEIYIRNLIYLQNKLGHEVSLVTALPPISSLQVPVIDIPDLASYRHRQARQSVSQLKTQLLLLAPDLIHIHDLNNPYVITECGQNFPTIKTTLNADAYCGGIDKYLPTSEKACEYKMDYSCLLIAYYENCMRRNPKRAIEIISLKKKALRASKYLFAHVVPSKTSKEILMQNGVSEEKIRIIPLFTNFDVSVQETKHPRNQKILFIGRLRPYKGARYFLQALSKIKTSFEATILGDGEERHSLEQLTQELCLHQKVKFVGNVSHDETGKYFDSASIVIVPSIYPDSFPTVGLEAMAHARPVIGFRIGGIPEWLLGECTGFLVTPQDTADLAKKIEQLLLDPELSEKMGRAGLERYKQHYTESAHEKLIENLYQDCLSQSKVSVSAR